MSSQDPKRQEVYLGEDGELRPAQPETGPAVFCSECGTANRAGSRFCRGCGQPLEDQVIDAQAALPRHKSKRLIDAVDMLSAPVPVVMPSPENNPWPNIALELTTMLLVAGICIAMVTANQGEYVALPLLAWFLVEIVRRRRR